MRFSPISVGACCAQRSDVAHGHDKTGGTQRRSPQDSVSRPLALHTTIQRIDAQRRESGEAAKWEQDLAEMQKNLPQGPQKGPHADTIEVRREA